MKKLTLGILAHADSGKTTLSEALLYKTGTIRNMGRVDNANTFLDTFELERKRGITIFSKQASFNTENFEITLVDTPGHVDFCAEAERVLCILDVAILVISGSAGVQSHTVTLWNLLRKHNIPTVIFVNKCDSSNFDKETITLGIQKKLSQHAIDTSLFSDFEELAMSNEVLLEKYSGGEKIEDEDIREEIFSCRLFPVLFGSALKLYGIDELVSFIDTYCKEPIYNEEFAARVFKITHGQNAERITHLKITGGKLCVKDKITYTTNSGESICEKVEQIRIYQGEKYSNVEKADFGTVCSVVGFSSLLPGDVLGNESEKSKATLVPILDYCLILPKELDCIKAMSLFKVLESEDPTIKLRYDEALGEIHMLLMGEMQVEIKKHEIKERFGYEVDFGEGGIIYRETIEDTVEGIGHYEPLRHYAEVHFLLSPTNRGDGLIFESDCDLNELDASTQRLILSHLEEKVHKGVLTRSPITDIRITLVSGKAHKKHTEGGDFRQATYRAVRQGLMKAKSVLLEPWYSFEITVPTENVGRVMTDIEKMKGNVSMPESFGDESVIKGSAPVSQMRTYSKNLADISHGKGRISLTFSKYDVCQNEDEVIERLAYDPESDIHNSPDSVFCQNGTSLYVKWSNVEEYMHLPSIFSKDKEDEENKAILKKRAEDYCRAVSTDKELMEIFERTYGPIKKRSESKVRLNPSPSLDSKRVQKQKPSHMPKGPKYLLIDGYNIIFAWDEMKKKAMSNLEFARGELIERLCNYQGFSKQNIILVFDAYKVHKNPGSVENFRNITVVYTKEAETADTYIEKTAHKLSRDHIVRVATSDGPEQMIILGSGALRVPANSFIKELTDAEEAIRAFIASDSL